MGMNGGVRTGARIRRDSSQREDADDPLGLFRHFGASTASTRAARAGSSTMPSVRRSCSARAGVTTAEIKLRFKTLKRRHPDANGDRPPRIVAEIIQAYNYLVGGFADRHPPPARFHASTTTSFEPVGERARLNQPHLKS